MKHFFTACLALGAAMLSPLAHAQSSAALPAATTFVVPYGAGGAADFIGRELASALESQGKLKVSVLNKPGAGGTIGSLAVSKAAPDGKTWVVCGLGSHVVGPLMRDVGYDPREDFSIATIIGGPPSALISASSTPLKNLSDLQNMPLTWASPGVGTHGHLLGALLAAERGLTSNHVPFKGGSGVVQAVMGGHTQAGLATITSIGGASESPLMRVLAVSSQTRSPLIPNVPTFAELGLPKLTSLTWFGLCGPKGVPAPTLAAMNALVQAALNQPEVQSRFAQNGVELLSLTPSDSSAFVDAEKSRWAPIIDQIPK